jgi:hypothetical protein
MVGVALRVNLKCASVHLLVGGWLVQAGSCLQMSPYMFTCKCFQSTSSKSNTCSAHPEAIWSQAATKARGTHEDIVALTNNPFDYLSILNTGHHRSEGHWNLR